MAKRGTPDHPKTKDLARRLNITISHAVGLLEVMWHFTAERAKDGGIGKYTNEQLAEELYWQGHPDVLVNALIDAVWLEPHPIVRLYIHDWPDHCDDFVHMSLARTKQVFADGTVPKLTRLSKADQEILRPLLDGISQSLRASIIEASSQSYARTVRTQPCEDTVCDGLCDAEKQSVRTTQNQDNLNLGQKSVRTALPMPMPLSNTISSSLSPNTEGVRTDEEESEHLPEAGTLDLVVPVTLEDEIVAILCEVPNFAIKPPKLSSIQELVSEFPQLTPDTWRSTARHARDWALTADRYKDPKKAGSAASFFRTWISRGIKKLVEEQTERRALLASGAAPDPERRRPQDGVDFTLKRVDGGIRRVIPGTTTPFDEEAWRRDRSIG